MAMRVGGKMNSLPLLQALFLKNHKTDDCEIRQQETIDPLGYISLAETISLSSFVFA